MKKHSFRLFAFSALLGSMVLPIACAPVGAEYEEITAERIARPAFMVERKLTADGLTLQLWERMHNPGQPANVYIEGDGDDTASNNPSPDNPVAIHLASRDNAGNLLYIARPCQFQESPDKKECDPKFWTNRRFSPEVVAAYNAVLDEVKLRYSITEFNLIGYDGGANIAAALATTRKDVATLRTVAGTLVPNVVYAKAKTPLDGDSITAFSVAPSLSSVPQHHFIGAGDEIAPPSVYHSFRQEMGDSECVHYTLVQDADHTRGWVEKWPELLKASTSCPPPYVPAPLPPRPLSKDGPNK